MNSVKDMGRDWFLVNKLTEDDKQFCKSIFESVLQLYESMGEGKPLNPTLLIIKANLQKALVELSKENTDIDAYNTALKAMRDFSNIEQIEDN